MSGNSEEVPREPEIGMIEKIVLTGSLLAVTIPLFPFPAAGSIARMGIMKGADKIRTRRGKESYGKRRIVASTLFPYANLIPYEKLIEYIEKRKGI